MKQPCQQVYRIATLILIAPTIMSDIQHPQNNHKTNQNCTFGTILDMKRVKIWQISLQWICLCHNQLEKWEKHFKNFSSEFSWSVHMLQKPSVVFTLSDRLPLAFNRTTGTHGSRISQTWGTSLKRDRQRGGRVSWLINASVITVCGYFCLTSLLPTW